MLVFMLAWGSAPLMLLDGRFVWLTAGFFLLAVAAITYNDLRLKGKTIRETAVSFPVLLAYYHVRLAGYLSETVRLRIGRSGIKRVRLADPGTGDEA